MTVFKEYIRWHERDEVEERFKALGFRNVTTEQMGNSDHYKLVADYPEEQ